MEIELYSCFCLFDACLFGFDANDSYPALVKRISVFLNDEYKKKKAEGLCSCSMCRPPRYNHGYWNLRLYSVSKEFRYFCCNDHSYQMLNIMPDLTDELAIILNRSCLNCYVLFNFSGLPSKPSCYFYWKYEAITLNDFFSKCKMYFLRSQHFKLKKLSSNNDTTFHFYRTRKGNRILFVYAVCFLRGTFSYRI